MYFLNLCYTKKVDINNNCPPFRIVLTMPVLSKNLCIIPPNFEDNFKSMY